jgi:hypothetical protein
MASVTVVKTIGTTGDFSTPQLWDDGAPADLTTAEQSPANTFTAGFVQGEALTFTGSGATGKFLHTDGSTFITYGITAGNPASGDVVSGATGLCTLTSSTADFVGVIWQGQCQNQEFSGAGSKLDIAGSTSSSSAYKECTTAAGASFRDRENVQTNALRYNAANGCGFLGTSDDTHTVTMSETSTRLSNIQMTATGTNGRTISTSGSTDVQMNNLIIEGVYTGTLSSVGSVALTGTNPTIANSVIIQRATGSDHIVATGTTSGSLYNCTIVAPDDLAAAPTRIFLSSVSGTVTVQNCGLFAGDSTKALSQGSATFNYTTCYTDTASPPAGVTQTTYSSEFQDVNDATRDFRLVTGAAQKDTGTTDTTNAAIDIAGTARPSGAAYDVGAWEFVQDASPPSHMFRGS